MSHSFEACVSSVVPAVRRSLPPPLLIQNTVPKRIPEKKIALKSRVSIRPVGQLIKRPFPLGYSLINSAAHL